MPPPNWPGDPQQMHFRLQHDRLGVLDLDCDSGYVVQAYDLGHPEVREVMIPNALDDGTFDLTRFYGSRAITLDIALKPHSGTGPSSPFIAAESVLRDRLLAYTYPGIRPVMVFSEHQDERIKQVLLRGSDASIAVSQKNYNKINVSWVAPRGVLLSYEPRCYSYAFSSATADTVTQTLLNDGSAPAHWQAVLSGESVQPRFICHSGDMMQMLQLDYASGPGDVVVVDSFSRTVSVNGVATGYRYVNDLSEWFQIEPGMCELTVEQDTYTAEGYPFAFWQPARYLNASGAVAGAALSEPFDNFTTNGWVITGSPTIVAGRTGTAAKVVGLTDGIIYNISPGSQSDVITVGLAFRTVGFAGQPIVLGLYSGATKVCHLVAAAGGSLALVKDPAGVNVPGTLIGGLAANTWHYIEAQIKLSDTSTGWTKGRVDGVEMWNVTGEATTTVAGVTNFTAIEIGSKALVSDERLWDDLYLDMGAGKPFRGNTVIGSAASATLPDPGVLPNTCTFVFKVRGPTTATGALVNQWAASNQSWLLQRTTAGALVLFSSPATNGAGAVSLSVAAQTPTGDDETLALAVTFNDGSGQWRMTSYRHDGSTWTQLAVANRATVVPADASSVVRVGMNTITAGQTWDGRIYSVELRSGLDPAGGTVLWRYAASNLPSGATTYTDPRGQVWTLTSSSAVRSAPLGPVGAVLSEPFDDFTTNGWAVTGTPAPTIVAGRTGTAASLRTASANFGRASYPIADVAESDWLTVGFAWNTDSFINAHNIIAFYSDNNTTRHCNLFTDATGAIGFQVGAALGFTPAGSISLNTWHYIEARVRLGDDPNGSYEVRIDGVLLLSDLSCDTRQGGTKTVFDTIRLGSETALGTITQLYDDLYLSTGPGATFAGDFALEAPDITNWAIPPGTTPPNNPPPVGRPPWAWTTQVDPETGLPGQLSIQFCYFDTFV